MGLGFHDDRRHIPRREHGRQGPVAQSGRFAAGGGNPEESIRLLTGWSGVRMEDACPAGADVLPNIPAGPLEGNTRPGGG
jgi:hypothetical protein